jgi:hypothetical protein
MAEERQLDSEHLTFEICGRIALPVRAIPYVTDWGVGELVQHFSRKVGAPFERLQEVYAYHLLSGQPIKYLPREWDGVQINLDALSAELHEKFKNDDQGYAAWCREAVAVLPEGLFVWLDEFEKDCAVNLAPNRIIFPKERDGDRELNYTPHLSTVTRETVLAGFDEFYTNPAKAETLPLVTTGEQKPWEVVDPKDPAPKHPWFTAARFFARQLVKEDSTFLIKKNLLANKTSQLLFQAKVFGRTKNKALDAGTILKAFTNVNLG